MGELPGRNSAPQIPIPDGLMTSYQPGALSDSWQPAPFNPPPFAPVPACTPEEIYTDSLQKPWGDWSWNKNDMALSNSDNVYKGSNSLKYTCSGNAPLPTRIVSYFMLITYWIRLRLRRVFQLGLRQERACHLFL